MLRNPNNPIITIEHLPYKAHSIFNAGATIFHDETILLCRVEDTRGISQLVILKSKNGVDGWQFINSTLPITEDEKFGMEDPRITYLPDKGQYAILYSSVGINGTGASLMLTSDFRSFDRRGQIYLPENKDTALFPRQINGEWIIIHRPVTNGHNMWLGYSSDLTYWGKNKVLCQTSDGNAWDSQSIGLALPPIETEEGWLVMYHSGKTTPGGCIYRCGLMLLNLDDPSQIISRAKSSIFGPREPYERIGDVGNVVFPCGYTQNEDDINIYYGAADTSICLVHSRITECLKWVKNN